MSDGTFRYRKPMALGDLAAAATERAFILAEIERMMPQVGSGGAVALAGLRNRIMAHRHYPQERGDHHV